jgi:membrane protease subunit (stomatin/prohibitin family)
MNFFSSLNCETYDTYKFKVNFPVQLIQKLVQDYDVIFICSLLKNELSVFMTQNTSKDNVLTKFYSGLVS